MPGLTRAETAHRAGTDVGYIDRLVDDSVAAGIRSGLIDLSFVAGSEYERFANISAETFEDVSARRLSLGGCLVVWGRRG